MAQSAPPQTAAPAAAGAAAVRWAQKSAAAGHFCRDDAHARSDYAGEDGRRYCGVCYPAPDEGGHRGGR